MEITKISYSIQSFVYWTRFCTGLFLHSRFLTTVCFWRLGPFYSNSPMHCPVNTCNWFKAKKWGNALCPMQSCKKSKLKKGSEKCLKTISICYIIILHSVYLNKLNKANSSLSSIMVYSPPVHRTFKLEKWGSRPNYLEMYT